MKPLSAVILSCGVALSGYFISQGIIFFKNANNTVDVRGHDERLVTATEGYLDLRTSVSSHDLKELSANVAHQQAVLRAFLREDACKKEEPYEIPVSISDNSTIAYEASMTRPPRYTARAGMICSSRDMNAIAAGLQKTSTLPEKGIVLESANVKYLFTDLASLKPQMLKQATLSARESAETFAKDAGVPLGRMLSANQGLFTITGPNSDYDEEASLMKKVRVVVRASYQLK